MTVKKNCWEVKNCGRKLGGHLVEEHGVCPAAAKDKFDGVNDGRNAGRVCWSVAGTFCNGVVQCTFATKIDSCLQCPFFQQVATEEDFDFILRPEEEIPVIKKS